MKIAVIILNYNSLSDTLECLDSLRKSTSKNELKIYVVDNNSIDGSQNTLKKLKNIEYIQNERNLGFSGGNNIAIKSALKDNCDLIVLLNSDTIVSPNLLLNLASTSKRADISSPKIFFAKGHEFHKNRYKQEDLGKVIWYAGGEINWANIYGKHIGVDQVDSRKFNKEISTEYATGACIAIKKEVFEEIGLFDDKYFLYLEDMDFCIRAKKHGFKIKFDPNGHVWHKNAKSVGGSGSEKQDYYFTKSRLVFAFKYAKLRTKLAVFKEIISKSNNKMKRKAIIDFLFRRFGEISTK